jgi:3-polyprenyl-4-hydroxybenzoate decarboxylase
MTGLRGRSIDPSRKAGLVTAKLGIDATVPSAERERFQRIGVPLEVQENTARKIASMANPLSPDRNRA